MSWRCLRCRAVNPPELKQCGCLPAPAPATKPLDSEQLVNHLLGRFHEDIRIGCSYGRLTRVLEELADVTHVMGRPLERELVRQAAIAAIGDSGLVPDPARLVDEAWRSTQRALEEAGAASHG